MDLILTKSAKTWNFPQLGNYDLKIAVNNNVTRCFLPRQQLHTISSLYFIFRSVNGQLPISDAFFYAEIPCYCLDMKKIDDNT